MSEFTTRPELRGTFGAVSSTHWLASSAGMALLEAGHTAFDAAVAAGFVLQVVEPHLNGPGGEVPIMVTPAGADEPVVICGQGGSPRRATPEAMRALGIDAIPGTGLLPACVPGAFGAWLTLLRDYGTAELDEVLAPAIHYAELGHPIVPRIARTIETMRDLFTTRWHSSAEVYLPGGSAPEAGRLLRNPQIAALYREIVRVAGTAETREQRIEAALGYWYEGPVAERIGAFCANEAVWDVSGRHHRGFLDADDLAGWRPAIERPVSASFAGHVIHKCGPWSQGPALLQALQILEGTDVASCEPAGERVVHLAVEASKLALADRDAWYGDDPHVPLEELLDADYAERRRALIGESASLELRPGGLPDRPTRFPSWAGSGSRPSPQAGIGEPTAPRSPLAADPAGEPRLDASGTQRGDTCQVSAVDRFGNMVTATPSGGWFQSSPVIPGLGFSLTTRGQMFWLEPGLASSLRPGTRPRTTLTPTTVFRDGTPYLALGTPGGDQQEQWQLLFLLRHLHHGIDLQAAIDMPAFHTDHLVSSFWPREVALGSVTVEGRFAPDAIDALRRRGHEITIADPWSEGRLSVVGRRLDGGTQVVMAAANPRGMQGYAVAR
ncbi:gamma-glutamyltransferase family protein [Salinarimonas rosea]|uniref:gamma-glutamyltransferase family protein n=1 Tax=Salinarimonas rosea TaxID=552063 RepID=UPI00041ECF49|nr:gamma-glutamyltransferase [Salinarimonas rosea]